MLSRCVGEESQGKVLAVQSVLENLGKVLGPMLHTAVHGRKLPLLISSVDHVISVVFYMLAQYHPDHLLVTVILGLAIYAVSSWQGKVLAVQSVLENLAKVLGPMLHTAVNF
nr:hypothetical protein BaRGS_000794 [Batillaria attramentaria]